MINWDEKDWVYHEFLVTLCRLFENEDKLIQYDGYHIRMDSIYIGLESKYLDDVGKPYGIGNK